MKRFVSVLVMVALGALGVAGPARAQAPPIEGELVLITPVSKFIHDASLKIGRAHV